jgi:hypothetical protein
VTDFLSDPAYLAGIVTGALTVVAAIAVRERLHSRRLRRAWQARRFDRPTLVDPEQHLVDPERHGG